ncbi:Ca2+-transporting ATPase [Hydrogenivirga caldilitoris]|uniref:Ca2+-transporting ATPase n=1 Tax=Hydrogenivirga caldilitoris TaxID=246264 RepID=A0A497XUN0_9AQUI|nr:cation-transporting P-type ATPase [Hydrogenivirga caldilitoris]RLJ70603.1 Ca2+-transporting ATPase [Hydrogenivirga caldilitoris]
MDNYKAHTLTPEDLIERLGTSINGLSEEEAQRRLRIYGRNEVEQKRESSLEIFFRQFKSPLVYILIAASLVSIAIGETFDFILIVGIILVNSLLGFIQEHRAISSLESLKRMTESKVRVKREGVVKLVPSSFLVPGDVVSLSEGDVVPADIRLLKAEGLLVDESVLTGESIPVEKDSDVLLSEDAPIYERKNLLFKGTIVVKGHCEGVVYATGARTELGKISLRAEEKSPDTPLTRALKAFSRRWMLLLLFLLLLLLAVGVLQGRGIYEVALLVIAELVSAVPEGLPIVITLVLVVGAVRLSRRKTYIRYLPAAETLGSTTYITTDKTGTITEGKLKVMKVYEVDAEMLRLVAALCNNSDGSSGDPVEVALVKWLKGMDFDVLRVREACPRLREFPFDTRKRYMTTVHRCDGGKLLLIKGALESLGSLSEDVPKDILEEHDRMAEEGLRVLAFGYAQVEEIPSSPEEVKIRIVGLVGFLDPPKEGVREAVEIAKKAGIRVIMLTGDNLKTAKAVGREVGIYGEGSWAVEGRQIESYTDEELYNALKRITVVARALPEDKYRIVRVLQSRGEVVAVTGDGINDVPALKVADIGIAMGSGAQAARDVAKMVIADNNLSVIVDAVRWGRVIARNIRRAIYYLLSSSFDEVILLSLAFLMKLPFPLYPTQILWINLVTDGVQDKAFPFNGEERDLMREKPRKPEKVFFDRRQLIDTLSTALFVGFANILLFRYLLEMCDYEHALSVTFTSMVVNQWFNGVQTIRDLPFFYRPWRNFTLNPYVYAGLLIGLLLQLSALYLFPEFLHAVPLNFRDWLYVLLTSFGLFLFIEMRKFLWLLFEKKLTSR